MLTRQLTSVRGNISIDTLSLLLSKLRNIIPVLLQTVCNLIRRLGITQLQDRVVVHRPVLSLLIGAPDLLSFDAKYLHANAAWRGHVVRDELRSERGVAHNAVIASGLCEHALGKVWWEIVVDNEFTNHALRLWLITGRHVSYMRPTHALGLEVCATKTVHVFIEV